MNARQGGAVEAESSETEIEVTPAMIEAGLERLYEFDITQPDPAELRLAVEAVLRAGLESHRKCPS
jgi:hypothetical protein